jgi:hypothetical protein
MILILLKLLTFINYDDTLRFCSWTQSISNGHLSIPSYEWLNLFKKWEEFFVAFHQRQGKEKWDLNRSDGVCAQLRAILAAKFPSVSAEAIKLYVKVRTMLRIKSLNNVIKNSRYQRKNKAKEFSSSTLPVQQPPVTDWNRLFHAVIHPEQYVDVEEESPHLDDLESY